MGYATEESRALEAKAFLKCAVMRSSRECRVSGPGALAGFGILRRILWYPRKSRLEGAYTL